MKKLIKEYKKHIEEVERLGKLIAELLCSVIKKHITDIEYTLGWEEAGIDTICFWTSLKEFSWENPKYKQFMEERLKNREGEYNPPYKKLINTIIEVFPELEGYISTPITILLSKESAQNLKKDLKKLKESYVNFQDFPP